MSQIGIECPHCRNFGVHGCEPSHEYRRRVGDVASRGESNWRPTLAGQLSAVRQFNRTAPQGYRRIRKCPNRRCANGWESVELPFDFIEHLLTGVSRILQHQHSTLQGTHSAIEAISSVMYVDLARDD